MAFLIDTIDSSGLFAQSANSATIATKDSNGNDITATYQSVGDYYSASNPSGFITGVDLSPYQTKDDMSAYQPSGDYYSASNPSGFITDVPAGTLNESAFEFDNGLISAYNGSAFKAGDELPESVSAATDYVTATSGDINDTINNVSANSGTWGGSALPISAGSGIKLEMINDTLVASTDETVLWSGTPSTSINVSEPFSNFESIKITAYAEEQNSGMAQTFEFLGTNTAFDLHIYNYNSNGSSITNYLTRYNINGTNFSASIINHWWAAISAFKNGTWSGPGASPVIPTKVIGINRIAGGN